MNVLTQQSIKTIFDFATSEPLLSVRMDTYEGQIKRSSEGVERSSLIIAACLYGIKKCFDYYHRVERDGTTYTNIYEYAEDLFGFKKTSTKNAINVIETYFDENGTLKPSFRAFGYSQLVELLPFKAELPKGITSDITVKELRELKKAGQTSDQSEPTPLEVLSDEKPYASGEYLFANNKTFQIYQSQDISWQSPYEKRIKTVLGEVFTADRTFNTYVLNDGQYAAVEVYNGENAARAHWNQSESAQKTVEEDIEDAIVEEIDGNADEISEDNTTNGLDYLLDGQTSDQNNQPGYIYNGHIVDKLTEQQPKLHLFKNKKEREEFIKDYKPWGVWKELPELGLKFYRYVFANGAVLIVTECPEYHFWATEKWVTTARHCLILEEDFELPNSYGSGCCRAYDLSGTAPTYIVDYMTKKAKEI